MCATWVIWDEQYRGSASTMATPIPGVFYYQRTVPGWLPGAATNGLRTALWTVPTAGYQPRPYAVVNQSETNSIRPQHSISKTSAERPCGIVCILHCTDERVSPVLAQVQNLGAPTATNSTLAIRLMDQRAFRWPR